MTDAAASGQFERFEFERIVGKFDWIRLVEALPATSPLFRHELCEARCSRKDGRTGQRSLLRAATIKHVGVTLAHHAREDGTRAFPGINVLAAETSRHRSTVIAALGHLRTVGLIADRIRGSSYGIPRGFATEYCLMSPPLEILAGSAANDTEARIYDYFARPPDRRPG